VVLERDDLPGAPDHRAGTPQSRHLHGLLAGGLQALTELFPRFRDDLIRAGAVPLRAGLDVRVESPDFDPFPMRDLGWSSYAASRPTIEFVARQCLLGQANVRLRAQCRVTEIVWNPEEAAVTGVRCLDADGHGFALPADLVVDASGRGQLTLDLLQLAGYPAVPQTRIGVDIGYASATYEMPVGAGRAWKGVRTLPKAPQSSRSALMLPLEGNRSMVSLGGRGNEKPPGDEAGFLDFVRHLRTPTIHDAICGIRPEGAIARYAFRHSVRRHFERLPAFPRALLPVGDAVCVFNPVYGQGMTVAAQEALALRRVLATAARRSDPLSALAPAFFAEVQSLLETPWAMSAIPDFVFPQTTGMPPEASSKPRSSTSTTASCLPRHLGRLPGAYERIHPHRRRPISFVQAATRT